MFEVSVLKGTSGKRSMLIQFADIFPECKFTLRETTLPPLTCWQMNNCHLSSYNLCMVKLLDRVYRIFDNFDKLDLIVLWWIQKMFTPVGLPHDRRMGLIVHKDENAQMRMAPLNKWAIDAVEKRLGERYRIDMGVFT